MKHEDVVIKKIAVNPFYRKMSVYLYYLDGLLIDTGPRIGRFSLIPFFKSKDIQQVALTHHHKDHVGMVSWIGNHRSAKIYCHPNMKSMIAEELRTPWYQKVFKNHEPKLMTIPKVIKTSNHYIYTIETPGHTKDHVCLLEPDNGWLFTGDLYVTPYPKVFLKGESMSKYIESLEKLCALEFSTLFCGHQGVVQNGKEMLKKKLEYLKEVKSEVVRLHNLDYTDEEIIQELFPEKVDLELYTLGSFSRLNLVRACYQE